MEKQQKRKGTKPKVKRLYGPMDDDLEDLDAILLAVSMWLEADTDNNKLAAKFTLVSVLRWNLNKRFRV